MPACRTPHLHLRGSVFWFRMAIPRSLIERIGIRELKGSLKTRDVLIARRRSRRLTSACELLFLRVGAMVELNHETIKTLVRSYFQDCLNQTDERISFLRDDPSVDLDAEAKSADQLVKAHLDLIKMGKPDAVSRDEAQRLIERHHIEPASVPLNLRHDLNTLILRARVEDWRIAGAKLRAEFEHTSPKDPIFAGLEVSGYPPLPDEEKDKAFAEPVTLAQTVERFIEMKSTKWVRKTLMDNKRVLDLTVRVIGATTPVSNFDKASVRRVRDTVMKLPASYMKRKDQVDLELVELFASDAPKLSAKTQKKYFEMFRSFLKWCVEDGYLDAVPGEGIKIAGPSKAEAQRARYPFSTDQLQRLFTSPLYSGCKSAARRSTAGDIVIRDGRWWIPLVGLYSGLRLGEIVQLLVTDIRWQDDIAYFDVARGEGEDKQIKTASSVRKVPVHPRLIEFGLLDHVEKARRAGPKARVFADIAPGKDGYFSHNFSKSFGFYVRSVGVKTPKTSFHSLRHNFKDALVLAEVPDMVRLALMGHADGHVHATYGSGASLHLLRDAVWKVEYKIKIGGVDE